MCIVVVLARASLFIYFFLGEKGRDVWWLIKAITTFRLCMCCLCLIKKKKKENEEKENGVFLKIGGDAFFIEFITIIDDDDDDNYSLHHHN